MPATRCCGCGARVSFRATENVWAAKCFRATQIAEGEERMKTQLTAVLAGGALVMMGGGALARHSFAMFNMANPIEIQGTVKEFRFVSPHTILIVTVKGEDGIEKDWILEGGAPGLQVREGLTS